MRFQNSLQAEHTSKVTSALVTAVFFGLTLASSACDFHSESFEVFGFDDSGRIIDVGAVVGNTGLVAGQGHLRADLWSPNETPTRIAFHVSPAETFAHDNGIEFGFNHLVKQKAEWEAVTRSDTANSRFRIAPKDDNYNVTVTDDQLTVTAEVTSGVLNGWVEAGKRGGKLAGHGVVLHRRHNALLFTPRKAAFVLDHNISIGIDQQGNVLLAWATINGERLDSTSATITSFPKQPVVLDFRPSADLVVTIKRRKPMGATAVFGHLNLVERWLLKIANQWRQRKVRMGYATISFNGKTSESRAVLLTVGPNNFNGK